MQKITPFLWFDDNMDEAIDFYTSVFKSSKVINKNSMTATIELEGQELHLLNGGPMFKFTEAISFFIHCETQEEIDYYWNRLTEDGEESRCGWLKDKFGLSWQVVPSMLMTLLWSDNKLKSNAAMQAMLRMNKLDIQKLQDAYDND